MTLKKGEYIRLKNGTIAKITGKDVDEHYLIEVDYNGGKFLTKFELEDIVKHSENLIDLIEKGDFVNGQRIVEIKDKKRLMTRYYPTTYMEDKIRTVLTYEQYEKCCYKED